jgi:hypothetical protein
MTRAMVWQVEGHAGAQLLLSAFSSTSFGEKPFINTDTGTVHTTPVKGPGLSHCVCTVHFFKGM